MRSVAVNILSAASSRDENYSRRFAGPPHNKGLVAIISRLDGLSHDGRNSVRGLQMKIFPRPVEVDRQQIGAVEMVQIAVGLKRG